MVDAKESLDNKITFIDEFKYYAYLLKKSPLTMVGVVIILILIIFALFAPFIAPYPMDATNETHIADKLLQPSMDHLFGTDELGRDIFSRVIYGTRISLGIGTLVVALSLAIGIPLGLLSGYYGGFIDEIIMRITDVFLSFPPMLLAVVIASFLGRNLTNAMIAIAISWWPWYTRLIRSEAISLKSRPFVEASKAIGTSDFTIMFVHILYNSLTPIIVQASMDFGSVILTSAALSFLGLGAQPPQPEWGLMINTSRNYFLTAPWYSIFPGMFIFATVLAFNFLGDGLREFMDPKLRRL